MVFTAPYIPLDKTMHRKWRHHIFLDFRENPALSMCQ